MRVNRELAGTYSRVKDWAKRFREGRAIERVSKMMKNPSNLVITPHIIDMGFFQMDAAPLTQEQKSTRVSCAQELLKMYEQANSRRLGEICTGDETWIMHAEPLRKDQSKTWLPKGAPPSTHPRPDFRAKKVCTVYSSIHRG